VKFESTGRLPDDLVVEARSIGGEDPMETFDKLFGSVLVFIYHCCDRIVQRGWVVATGSGSPHIFLETLESP
jgi:hypothetical protein